MACFHAFSDSSLENPTTPASKKTALEPNPGPTATACYRIDGEQQHAEDRRVYSSIAKQHL